MWTPKLRMDGLGSVCGSQQKDPTGDQVLRILSGSRKKSGRRTSRGCLRKKGKASRVIATLEALATLLAVRAFFPLADPARRTRLLVVPSYTDNRGNGALLNKLMSSKFPLSALLMEFGEQLRYSGARPDVWWAPRETNCEADRLANGDTAPSSTHCSSLQPVAGLFSTKRSGLGKPLRLRRRGTEPKVV